MDKRILSFFGLAQRSGNLITGEDTCEYHIKKGHIRLLIVAQDASENTKKKFKDMCEFRGIQHIVFGERDELSAAIGKSNRAVYAIKDTAFANKIYSLIVESMEGLNFLGGE